MSGSLNSESTKVSKVTSIRLRLMSELSAGSNAESESAVDGVCNFSRNWCSRNADMSFLGPCFGPDFVSNCV